MRAEQRQLAAALAITVLLVTEVMTLGREQYAMRGMVMKVAPSHRSFIVSHDSVPGVMDAMLMSFDVRDPKALDGVQPGMTVTFTLVVENGATYVTDIQVRPYQPSEQDPLTAQRLRLLKQMTSAAASVPKPVAIGQVIPDFRLIDQVRRPVTFSAFRGKVVAVNFIYTSCVLPQFCFRIANNFGVLQRRFKERVGRDLILLTVTFDPARDGPEQLAQYAAQWHASPDTWHFLTGAVPDVKRVCALFGVDFFPDEGLMNHSSHTALVDRKGRLVANIEGNEFTAGQLGDLVEITLKE